jgi:hypothetical protein
MQVRTLHVNHDDKRTSHKKKKKEAPRTVTVAK